MDPTTKLFLPGHFTIFCEASRKKFIGKGQYVPNAEAILVMKPQGATVRGPQPMGTRTSGLAERPAAVDVRICA